MKTRLHVTHELVGKYERQELMANTLLKRIGFSLSGIFIPIYLLTVIELSVKEVLLFGMIAYSFFAFFSPVSAKIVSKIGLKHTMILSLFFYFAFFSKLISVEKNFLDLFIAASALGLGWSIYFTAWWTDLIMFSRKKKKGHDAAAMIYVDIISLAVSPFIGGLIITFFGYSANFYAGIALISLSAVPLLLTKDRKAKFEFSIIDELKAIIKKYRKKEMIGFIGYGVHDLSEIFLWPLIVFSIFGSILFYGLYYSLTLIIAMILIYFLYKEIDSNHKNPIKKIVGLSSSAWLGRVLIFNELSFALFNSIANLAYSMLYVSLDSKIIEEGKKEEEYLRYVVMRIISLGIGGLLISGIFFAMLSFELPIQFLLVAVALLSLTQMKLA
ncbi:MAG TPA: hypothetical protein VJK05_05695 [archaeon]|nr:hypothetical protein [archaeon]